MISNYTKQGSDKHGATSEYPASYVCRCSLKKEEHSRVFSDERLTLETSAFESLYGDQFTLFTNQPVDKTKLSCNTPHRRSTTVSLETYPLYSCVLFKFITDESVLLGTKPLVDSIRHFIRGPSGVFSVCHLCECHIVQ